MFITIPVIFFFHMLFFTSQNNVSIVSSVFIFSLQSIFRKRWKKLFLSEGSVTILQVKSDWNVPPE